MLAGAIPQNYVTPRWLPVTAPASEDFAAVRSLLIRAFPAGAGTPAARYRYAVSRGTISVATTRPPYTTETSNVELTWRGSFALEVEQGTHLFACGRVNGRRLPIELALGITLSLANDWSLEATQHDATISLPEGCRLRPGADAAPALREAGRRLLADAAARLAGLAVTGGKALRSNAEIVWAILSQPFAVAGQAWLLLDPQSLPFETPNIEAGDGLTLQLRFGLVAQPRLTIGARPSVALKPLPDLAGGAHGPNGVHVAVDARVPFDLLSQELTAKLKGTRIPLQPLGSIEIRLVEAYGSTGGKLAVRIGYSGAASGDAYFVGTPSFDPQTHVIAMPDLDFTVVTHNLLVNLAEPFVRSHRFIDLLRRRATFDASAVLDRELAGVTRGFNQSLDGPAGTKIQFGGTLDRVRFGGLAIDGDDLVLRGVADGEARVTIEATAALP